ncbi:hypothetical protein OPT61_g1376 [Boeremia exigua]|uniref:Uncharacterized protein n=1 Tax=Boeremia exigua TaxID=749465 RepID=A0ACC2IQE8_9PLEO|nr:hypothetical protein OPT61_g1376 [Boeremia exigua]
MKFTQSLIVAAATLNLAIGAPIQQDKSRAIVAKEAVKRAVANNPYIAHDVSAGPNLTDGASTPRRLRSLIKMLKRTNVIDNVKRYKYVDTPAGLSRRGSAEDLDKRYKYVDTPAGLSRRGSAEDLDKRYKYVDTPAGLSRRGSAEDLDKRYKYVDTPAGLSRAVSAEDLTKV